MEIGHRTVFQLFSANRETPVFTAAPITFVLLQILSRTGIKYRKEILKNSVYIYIRFRMLSHRHRRNLT